MKMIKVKDVSEKIQRLGRTLDGPEGEIYINWTCSGVRFQFTGTSLVVQMRAWAGEETDINLNEGSIILRKTWPYAAVYLDDQEEPHHIFEVNDVLINYMLFFSEQKESHTITLRKLTENPKGKIAVDRMLIEGEISESDTLSKSLKLEFVGDSITCGFGNMTDERNRLFFPQDENGWMSHAAIAARKLQADFNIISFSGIAVTEGLDKGKWELPSMMTLYPYTDRLIEETLGIENEFTKWDFKGNVPDAIIINLGTNDATIIDVNDDPVKGSEKFEEDYYKFLKMIRELNGAYPWIICALGSMDYYLYDNICRVVKEFAKVNNDVRISCFKYGRIREQEGFGACAHPNLVSQMRMGSEIAAHLTKKLKLRA